MQQSLVNTTPAELLSSYLQGARGAFTVLTGSRTLHPQRPGTKQCSKASSTPPLQNPFPKPSSTTRFYRPERLRLRHYLTSCPAQSVQNHIWHHWSRYSGQELWHKIPSDPIPRKRATNSILLIIIIIIIITIIIIIAFGSYWRIGRLQELSGHPDSGQASQVDPRCNPSSLVRPPDLGARSRPRSC